MVRCRGARGNLTVVVVRGQARARRAGTSAANSHPRMPTRERRTPPSSAPGACVPRRSCVSQGELAQTARSIAAATDAEHAARQGPPTPAAGRSDRTDPRRTSVSTSPQRLPQNQTPTWTLAARRQGRAEERQTPTWTIAGGASRPPHRTWHWSPGRPPQKPMPVPWIRARKRLRRRSTSDAPFRYVASYPQAKASPCRPRRWAPPEMQSLRPGSQDVAGPSPPRLAPSRAHASPHTSRAPLRSVTGPVKGPVKGPATMRPFVGHPCSRQGAVPASCARLLPSQQSGTLLQGGARRRRPGENTLRTQRPRLSSLGTAAPKPSRPDTRSRCARGTTRPRTAAACVPAHRTRSGSAQCPSHRCGRRGCSSEAATAPAPQSTSSCACSSPHLCPSPHPSGCAPAPACACAPAPAAAPAPRYWRCRRMPRPTFPTRYSSLVRWPWNRRPGADRCNQPAHQQQGHQPQGHQQQDHRPAQQHQDHQQHQKKTKQYAPARALRSVGTQRTAQYSPAHARKPARPRPRAPGHCGRHKRGTCIPFDAGETRARRSVTSE